MDIPRRSVTVELDTERYNQVWRLATYVTANCLMEMQLSQLKLYKLAPLDLMIFNLVALASVQRSVRALRPADSMSDDIAPTDESNGSISLRRIADATVVPRTTVSRSLQHLIELGMITERGRGKLQVPVGVVLQERFSIDPIQLYAPVISLFEHFIRLGVVKITAPEEPTIAHIVSTKDNGTRLNQPT